MDDSLSPPSSRDNGDRSSDVTSPLSPPSMVKMGGSRGWLESERRYMQRRLDQLEERERRLEEESREARNYLCTVCSALCESTSDLQRHLSKHVSDLAKNPDNEKEPRVCRICSLEFISRMALNVHRNSPRHKEREMRIRSLFHCDHCGHYFANRDAYAMHMLDVTRESAAAIPNGSGKKAFNLGLVVGEVDTLSFLQSLAGKQTGSSGSSSPVEIVKVKEEPRDEGYGDVGKNGVTSSTEDAPEETSTTNNELESSNGITSGRKSREPLDLSHMKNEGLSLNLNSVDGHHVCQVCSQVFDSRDSLAMHAMEHCKDDIIEPPTQSSVVGGVPLTMASCHICGHRALSLGALNVHMLMHARPMDLTLDPKNCLSQLGYGSLVSEVVEQHSMNSFTCKLCDLDFQSFPSILKHCSRVMHIVKVEELLRKSFGINNLKCSDCGKSFDRECDFRIHKSLLCTAARRSPLQSPEPEPSVCSEPSRKRLSICERSEPKRMRSSSSDTGLLLTPPGTSSRKDRTTPLQERAPSSSRPLSVDSGRSQSPDHEAMANRQQILSYLENQDLQMCNYCKITYTDRTMYYLHMGLHNHNNPWQCNLCGRVCANVHEFSSHVIHYS